MYILITIDNGRYSTAVFDKRDSFTFNIVNFPHLSSNIPSKPAYGVYISQLVRIGRICSNFVQFKLRHYTLVTVHSARARQSKELILFTHAYKYIAYASL